MTSQKIAALHSFHRMSSDGWYLSSSFLYNRLVAVSVRHVVVGKACKLVFQGKLSGWNLQFLDFAWTSLHSKYRSTAVILMNTIGAVNLQNFAVKKY